MRSTNELSHERQGRMPWRANWRVVRRRALAALVIMNLALVVCVLTSPGARAASRLELRPRNVYSSSTRSSNVPPIPAAAPCSDPHQITPDCLSLSETVEPANRVQNPIEDGSSLFFFTDPSVTYQQPLVIKLWGIMLGAVDVCVVLMLILYGLQIMVAGTVFRYAQALESLPGALLGLIAAHVSMIFIVFFLSLNNALSVDLYNWANANAPISLKSGVTVTEPVSVYDPARAIAGPNGISCSFNPSLSNRACYVVKDITHEGLDITPIDLDFTSLLGNIHSLFDMLSLIIKILDLMLLAQFIIRVFFIDFYIALVPVIFACLALPNKMGYPVARLGIRGFLATILTQFCQVAALIVVELIVPAIFHELHSQLADQIIHADALVNLCHIGALWFIFRIPALLEESSTRTLIVAGQAMASAVVSTITVQMEILQTGVSAGLELAGTFAGLGGGQQQGNSATANGSGSGGNRIARNNPANGGPGASSNRGQSAASTEMPGAQAASAQSIDGPEAMPDMKDGLSSAQGTNAGGPTGVAPGGNGAETSRPGGRAAAVDEQANVSGQASSGQQGSGGTSDGAAALNSETIDRNLNDWEGERWLDWRNVGWMPDLDDL
jgi:hypothetical protein